MEETLRVTIAGVPVDASVIIDAETYFTSIDFTYMRTPYNFTPYAWNHYPGGMEVFMPLFHSVPRDPVVYGSVLEDGSYAGTAFQKRNCVMHAVRDIFATLSRIVEKHERSVLDYAVYYHNRYAIANPSYSEYITRLTCQNIIKAYFTAGGVHYETVLFQHA